MKATHAAMSGRKLNGIISGDKHAFRPDDTLRCAGDTMRALHAGAWPVVKDRRLIGMIDGPSPDWHAQRFGHDPDHARVSACMHEDVSHCYDDEDCALALEFMLSRHLRYMPVTDHDEQFLGIVSLDEVLGAVVGTAADKVVH